MKNVGLRPLYIMNKYIAKNYKSEKYRNEHYKLEEMENGIFSTQTLSFHLQIGRRIRRKAFIDGGKVTPFCPSLGFRSVHTDI